MQRGRASRAQQGRPQRRMRRKPSARRCGESGSRGTFAGAETVSLASLTVFPAPRSPSSPGASRKPARLQGVAGNLATFRGGPERDQGPAALFSRRQKCRGSKRTDNGETARRMQPSSCAMVGGARPWSKSYFLADRRLRHRGRGRQSLANQRSDAANRRIGLTKPRGEKVPLAKASNAPRPSSLRPRAALQQGPVAA